MYCAECYLYIHVVPSFIHKNICLWHKHIGCNHEIMGVFLSISNINFTDIINPRINPNEVSKNRSRCGRCMVPYEQPKSSNSHGLCQWRSHTRADQGFSPGNLHFQPVWAKEILTKTNCTYCYGLAKMPLGRYSLSPVILLLFTILGNEINYYHFCEYNLKYMLLVLRGYF